VEVNLKHIASHWTALHKALGLGRPIKSRCEYAQALAFVEQVFDAGLADGPLGGVNRLHSMSQRAEHKGHR
jgi:hypothetical protein